MKKKQDETKKTESVTSKSIKIFVDADDEILDIIDQIQTAESDRILLILPKNSLIGSSTVNLKLLSKKLLTLDKAVILITTSELATNKAHEASLITKAKVEEVDHELWKDAFVRLENLKTEMEERKKKFVNERKEKPELPKKKVEEPEVVETLAEDELTSLDEPVEEIVEEVVVEPEAESKMPSRPTYTPKITEVGGFAFMSGADINLHRLEKPKPNISQKKVAQAPLPIATETVLEKVPSQPIEPFSTGGNRTNNFGSGLVGKDITSNRPNRINRGKGNWYKRILIVLILLIPLLFFYRSQAETLEVNLEIETQQIELAEEVTADPNIQEVDLTTKKIPIIKASSTKSMSDSDATTGEGLKGDKATGVMDFFNKTQNEINLPAGTKLTTINKNLTFYLNASAKIPPAVSDITPSKLESVPIIAAQPGDEYNISDTDVKIEGFNPNSQLSGRIFRAVKGGTSEKVKVLTQEDVDRLKSSLTTTLTKLLTEDIDKSLDKDAIKLPNTNILTEKRFEVTPKVGEPAEEFSIIALEYEMSILTFNQKDLDKLANSLIAEKYNIENEDEIDSKQAATFENLQIAQEGTAKFSIRKQGRVKANINESVIKAAVENESLNNIGSKLSEIQEIKDYEIVYKPSFMPKFLQRVPADKSKIKINIQE